MDKKNPAKSTRDTNSRSNPNLVVAMRLGIV